MNRSRTATIAGSAVGAAALALSTLTGSAGAANAAPAAAPPLNVTYDAVGTSHIAKTNSDVALGPTTLKVAVAAADGSLTGHLPIPQTSTSFNAIGFLPTTAKVDFVESAPVTGKLNRVGSTTTVTSTAFYYIKLSDVKVAGLPAFVGDKCQTKAPVSVPANTPAGETYNLVSGGHLAGTFSIGDFEGCGLTTALINLLVPGGGNTVDLTVSNGRLG